METLNMNISKNKCTQFVQTTSLEKNNNLNLNLSLKRRRFSNLKQNSIEDKLLNEMRFL